MIFKLREETVLINAPPWLIKPPHRQLYSMYYNGYMTRFGIIIFSLFILLSSSTHVFADSDQSYKDYLYQADVYRTKYNQFAVAKNEYDKFNTLTSQSTALEKAKSMMVERDIMLKSYLQLLTDKLNENNGISDSDRQLYQEIINNENAFLDKHRQLSDAIASISDASTVSNNLTSHYIVLSTSIEQIIVELQIGNLTVNSRKFDQTLAQIDNFIQNNRMILAVPKQTIIDRWMVSIKNKRNLYQQKIDQISQDNYALKVTTQDELNKKSLDFTRGIGETRTYLLEGTSYINELMNVIKSKN
jgi:hypothetical protein